ncbi:efflux RND transporter permease subunit [Prochlorococcus marinus]|uniref:Putative RND family multidrug efflux transporter n=1 Tax=Prochlorococcus marinus (strain MIT 9303) TaxID=59922 RepID=A2C611_PROM3|nr:efflux RND transporter permease subunit [Prochlorococcus marinus]ABM76921.1 putative RND family multidrug efflux transporter [Prochlorococcus marinus str. MIT 9303]
MAFSDNFIKRPVLTTVCSILIVLVGIIAIPSLPIANLPNIASPLIQVTANYGGGNSLVTEQAVTNPLEQQINGVPGVNYISSTSDMEGQSTINVYFDESTDINIDQVNVQNRVSLAMPQLPEQVQATGVSVEQSNPSILLAYQVGSTQGQFDANYLNGLIYEQLYYPLGRVPGVANVAVLGGANPAYWLFINPDKLAANKLTAEDIINAIKSQNSVAIGGLVGGPPATGDQAYTYPILVENNGNLVSIEDFNNLIVSRTTSGNLLLLKDIGEVIYGSNTFTADAIDVNGHPAMTLAVYQTPDSNALDVSNDVVKVIDQFAAAAPPGVNVSQIYNIGQFIESSVEGVVDALGLAIVLVLLILFLFLQNWRATVIPSLAIPISLIGTFAFLKVFDFSINQLTLLGLVLATGLVVDDAIVVIEAVSKNIESGMRPRQAALACMGELFGALVATALALMAVFVPVAFYPGGIGIIYKQFALTIAFSIAISAFNALTFSPMLSGLILRSDKPREPKGWGWILAGVLVGLAFGRFTATAFGSWTYLLGVVLGGIASSNLPLIFRRFNSFFDDLQKRYAQLIKSLISKRRLILASLAGGILLTAFAFTAIPSAFIPEEDQGYGLGFYQLQNGASLSQTQQTGQQIAELLKTEKNINAASIVSGFGFNGSSPDQGAFFFGLKPLKERKGNSNSAAAIVDRLNAKLEKLSSAMAVSAQPPAVPGFSSQGGFYFQFNDLSNGSYSFNQLDGLANDLIKAGKASSEFSSLYTQFIPSAPAFGLQVDRAVMGALNVDYQEAMNTIATLAGSNYSGLTYENGQVRNIYVQSSAEQRNDINDILSYYVRSREGELVQVSQFASADLSSAPPVISHYNLYRTVLIQGAEAVGKSSGQALQAIQNLFQKQDFSNIGYAFTGLAALQLSAGSASIMVFGLGLLIVYLVLSAQYESYVTPVIILMTVPLAMLGALAFLAIRSIDLNIYAQVGLVTLIGLAAKNGILIVEVAEQNLKSGMTPSDAVIASAESRLRPILMTAIAALAGFLPLVVANGAGAHSQQSLGTVIFGGLVVATVLSLGVVPPFYVVVKHLEERWFSSEPQI